ncbi:MAG: cobalamin biosynthesis protein [Rickettsiales bacterium]
MTMGIEREGIGRITIGVGCRKECSAEEIIELVHEALEKSDITISEVAVLATAWVKEGAEPIIHAAEALDLPLVVISQEKCEEMTNLAETISQKVVDLFAIPSVAEVAALATAGKNPRLICARINSAAATCAIAVGKK